MSVSVSTRRLLLAGCGAAAFALAGCETVDETVNEVVGNAFSATLTGGSEVPGPGDPDGWGRARVTINDAANTICTDLEVRDIGDVTAAHIHQGGAGVAGPPVVTLDSPDDDDSDDCDTKDDALVDAIRNNPGAFYVNVHTVAHPDGAIRGQLAEHHD